MLLKICIQSWLSVLILLKRYFERFKGPLVANSASFIAYSLLFIAVCLKLTILKEAALM